MVDIDESKKNKILGILKTHNCLGYDKNDRKG